MNEKQEAWKAAYRKWLRAKSIHLQNAIIESRRLEMHRYRREAALERRIAALERENAALKNFVGKYDFWATEEDQYPSALNCKSFDEMLMSRDKLA